MKTLISIDPGLSTGVIVGTYSDAEPFRVTHAFQIEGGVDGFHETVITSWQWVDRVSTLCVYLPGTGQPVVVKRGVTFLAEKFNARGGANTRFSYTTASLEPLRVEGSIVTKDIPVTWVQPPQQYFLGGKSLQEKLKARNAWLKSHAELGYYLTGKSVGQKDADDARSALSHCISWLRRNRHKPTLDLFRKEEND